MFSAKISNIINKIPTFIAFVAIVAVHIVIIISFSLSTVYGAAGLTNVQSGNCAIYQIVSTATFRFVYVPFNVQNLK